MSLSIHFHSGLLMRDVTRTSRSLTRFRCDEGRSWSVDSTRGLSGQRGAGGGMGLRCVPATEQHDVREKRKELMQPDAVASARF